MIRVLKEQLRKVPLDWVEDAPRRESLPSVIPAPEPESIPRRGRSG